MSTEGISSEIENKKTSPQTGFLVKSISEDILKYISPKNFLNLENASRILVALLIGPYKETLLDLLNEDLQKKINSFNNGEFVSQPRIIEKYLFPTSRIGNYFGSRRIFPQLVEEKSYKIIKDILSKNESIIIETIYTCKDPLNFDNMTLRDDFILRSDINVFEHYLSQGDSVEFTESHRDPAGFTESIENSIIPFKAFEKKMWECTNSDNSGKKSFFDFLLEKKIKINVNLIINNSSNIHFPYEENNDYMFRYTKSFSYQQMSCQGPLNESKKEEESKRKNEEKELMMKKEEELRKKKEEESEKELRRKQEEEELRRKQEEEESMRKYEEEKQKEMMRKKQEEEKRKQIQKERRKRNHEKRRRNY